VLAIEEINDLGLAKQVASLYERECDTLRTRVQQLMRELARLRGEDVAQAELLEIEKLNQRIAQLERMTFGPSSERRPQESTEATAEEKPKQRGHGPRAQPTLPIRELLHVLPAEQGQCPECQGERKAWKDQFEESEEITVVQRRFEIVKHRRQKYLCRCDEKPIVTAPGPQKLSEGARYSIEFGVEVVVDKYLDHQPLDRQRRTMRREGLFIDTQTLWDQVEAVASCLLPVHEALHVRILQEPLVHADETHWWMITEPKAERWQAWAVACEHAACFQILQSRSAEAGRVLLRDFAGVAMVDGYSVYETLARAGPGMSLANCWAHYPEPAVIWSARRIPRRRRRRGRHRPEITAVSQRLSRKAMSPARGRHGVDRRAVRPALFQNFSSTWRFMSRLVLR